MVQHALAEVEVADRLGFDYVWANEHHFLEEYSHNSAPEVFLAAVAGRTRQIHVGHAVVLSPPGYNPPARVAERIAMLDLVSSGRAEWSTGSSASRAELEGFNIDPAQKKLMWAEATEQTANIRAGLRERGRDAQADAGRGAGDDGGLAGDVYHLRSPFRGVRSTRLPVGDR
jgi:alkanesulfonate monooxygenase SsuD/methylene tetrahydromethanopterin reductase-like flavin-dependent oxidoreductase (luciferase family)